MKEIPDKLYYRIEEISSFTGENASTIRFWENEFRLKPKIRKNVHLFTQEQVETFFLIQYLLREEQYTIEGAKKKLHNRRKAIRNKQTFIEALEKIKSDLKRIRKELE